VSFLPMSIMVVRYCTNENGARLAKIKQESARNITKRAKGLGHEYP